MSEIAQSDTTRTGKTLAGLNICMVYDCLFPLTHGGAERWYRVLTDRLVEAGATVTYLTRRQWTNEAPNWTGVTVIAVSRGGQLYDAEGTRRTGPAVSFGFGTFLWMARHRREFDAVVVASFPFFSLLAIQGALVGVNTPVFVDYHEVWSPQYWRRYAGRATGTLGALIQTLCVRVSRFAQVFTAESAERLRSQGFRGDLQVLPGLLPEGRDRGARRSVSSPDLMVLFVGRHLKHKGVRLLPETLATALVSLPSLRMTVVSDGPERVKVEKEMRRLGLVENVRFTGHVGDEELRDLFASASCTIVPSFREGYGIVVAESVAVGTPVVVADNPENLATTLVEPGINGFVVEPTVRGLSEGIVAVVAAGEGLRDSTAVWSVLHSKSKSINKSAAQMVERISIFARR